MNKLMKILYSSVGKTMVKNKGKWWVNSEKLWWISNIKNMIQERKMKGAECSKYIPTIKHYPEHIDAILDSVGFNPEFCKTLDDAKSLIEQLEKDRKYFFSVHLRITVQFCEERNFLFLRHANIENGKMSDFFWPPEYDWGKTPHFTVWKNNYFPIRFP